MKARAMALVDQVMPLERVSSAHERLESHHGRGKLVLSMPNR